MMRFIYCPILGFKYYFEPFKDRRTRRKNKR